ncbi:MAG: hypothetical protein R3200_17075 [Xanthomonadales bacterium]|nr:hypothetical protein [Xanthomonadales bacterium]
MDAPEGLQTHQDFHNHYVGQGYQSLGMSTHTGAEILRHRELGRVVKLTIAGKDPAVDFARLAQKSGHPGFPRVLEIHEGAEVQSWSGAKWRPCAIVMEELYPLTEDERKAYEKWVRGYLAWREQGGEKPEDALGMESAISEVIAKAGEMGGSVKVTLLEAKNIMARVDDDERSLVVIDPWY